MSRTVITVDPSGLFSLVRIVIDGETFAHTTMRADVTATSPEVMEFKRRLFHQPKPKEADE